MNEVFETLSGILEELRSESGERKYSIQTEETQSANKELKKKNKSYEKSFWIYLQTIGHS